MSAHDTRTTGSDASHELERLLAIMARLRDPQGGCPWDLEQDFATIAPYTIEEAYEVADAIERADMHDLCDELGDLLLQVVFHARMAEEQGAFAFAEVARRRGGEVVVAEDREEAELLVEARRLFSPAHAALGTDLVDDVCVPLTRLADLVDGVEAIGREHDVAVMASGHAGDGNMHPVVVFDGGDPASAARAEAAFAAIMRLGIALGGTITGEHGVGRLKVPFLGEEVGSASVDVHRSIKAALDPLGILNPGVVLGP